MRLRNLVGGLVVAVVLAGSFIVPAIAGISTWKYVLGIVGLALLVRAGRDPQRASPGAPDARS